MNQPPNVARRSAVGISNVARRSAVGIPSPQSPRINSPHKTAQLLLLAVVSVGIGCLIWSAVRVPAIASELSDWIGSSTTAADTPEGRRSQVIFLLLVYSAPLALAALVYVVSYLVARGSRQRDS